MLLVVVSFGLRISELLGLKWQDVDWLGKTIRIERGVVKQIVDDVKTNCSARTMVCADELLEVLNRWKQTTQFSAPDDWIFASPSKLVVCRLGIATSGRPLVMPQNWLALGISALTRSGTLTEVGLILWALR